MTNKTKEEMTKNLRFVKGVVESNDLLPLIVNKDTLQDSKIINVISKNLVSKDIEMLLSLVKRYKYRNYKDDDIDNKTKKVDINEVAETENDELAVDAANNAPHHQEDMNTTTTAASEEGKEEEDDVSAKGNDDNDEADDAMGREEGGGSGGQRWQQIRGSDGPDGSFTPHSSP